MKPEQERNWRRESEHGVDINIHESVCELHGYNHEVSSVPFVNFPIIVLKPALKPCLTDNLLDANSYLIQDHI